MTGNGGFRKIVLISRKNPGYSPVSMLKDFVQFRKWGIRSSLNFTGSKKRNKLNNVIVSSKITSTFELPDWKSFINGNYL